MSDPTSTPPRVGIPPLEFRPTLGDVRGCYLRGEDSLRITSSCWQGPTVAIEGRILTPTGEIVSFAERHAPDPNRTITSSTFHLGEGWLLEAVARVSVGTVKVGNCYVVLDLVRGQTGAFSQVAVLAAGFVTAVAKVGFPASGIQPAVGPVGFMRLVTGTDPGAGIEISEACPTGARWRLHSVQFDLVTDATVANREVSLVFDNGALVFARAPVGTNHAASLTRTYSAYRGAARNTIAQDTVLNVPLPLVDLNPAFRIRTVTTNLQAGDNLSAPQMLIEEFPEI